MSDSKAPADHSDAAPVALLDRLRVTHDEGEIRELADQIEKVIFHRQYENEAAVPENNRK
jgi:hypothetical protein